MGTMKVLIVDGSKSERTRLVDAFCQITNVVVIGAVARLHTALHALGQSAPDVLVTDSRIGDGEDATMLVAAARRAACPPGIVVYASEDSSDDRQRCLDAGADRFVAKRAGFPALQQAVLEVGLSRNVGMRTFSERAFVGRVASGLAHDLNNQLTVMDAALTLLQKQLASMAVAAAAGRMSELTLARRALDNASAVAQALSRHSHRSVHPPTRLDFTALVKRTLELFGRSIPMTVETELDLEPTPPVVGVEQELEQLVMNLVLDASDSMPSGGTIRVRVHSPAPSKVQMIVTRTGCAMPVHVDLDAAA